MSTRISSTKSSPAKTDVPGIADSVPAPKTYSMFSHVAKPNAPATKYTRAEGGSRNAEGNGQQRTTKCLTVSSTPAATTKALSQSRRTTQNMLCCSRRRNTSCRPKYSIDWGMPSSPAPAL